jgi:hypothetical protein
MSDLNENFYAKSSKITNKNSCYSWIQIAASFYENCLAIEKNHVDSGQLLKNDQTRTNNQRFDVSSGIEYVLDATFIFLSFFNGYLEMKATHLSSIFHYGVFASPYLN